MRITAGRGALLAVLALSVGGGSLEAQTDVQERAKDSSANTITLTKAVPVYEFENLKIGVDQYKVAPGDSLAKILKARGLRLPGGDQAQLLRLVRELNPGLKNLNALAVGEILKLPAAPLAAGAAPEEAVARPADRGAETVKIYERAQPDQQAARVVVLRRPPGDEFVEPAAPAPPPPAAGTEAAGASGAGVAGSLPVAAGGAPVVTVAGGGSPLDFPSGNAGPLALEPGSNVVYRTVKVRRGDTLERLLRREGLPREAIYRDLLKIVLDLNPQIKNADLIRVGAELRIPAAGEYLAAAGLNPGEVRAAALAINQRRRPEPIRLGAAAEAVRRLPEAARETAKNSLGLIFARLGDRVENQGPLVIPGTDGSLELDAAAYPLVSSLTGAKVVLDLGATLPPASVAALRAQNYRIFRPRRGETLDKALESLWPLLGYYRVYAKDRVYEGGGDIRLKISADWIVWPTEATWNSGQPLIINKTGQNGRGVDPAWSAFLAEHGLTIFDLNRDEISSPAEAGALAAAAPKAVTLDSANPRFLAAELVRQFGAEPQLNAAVELKGGLKITVPMYWDSGSHKAAVSFGELSAAEIAELRKNGFKAAVASLKPESAVEAVLSGFGFKVQEDWTATAPAGGPKMTLTIKGRVVTAGRRKHLLTYAALPLGLMRLLDPELKIIRY